ncbi:MAG: pseudouridine synthase [Thermohalobaculum sp.]|nr:pseudouridine synthase [Thermohalobaculum sp.]
MTRYTPPDAPLAVLHRDAELLLVDKPSGLLSVPGKPEAHRDCLEVRVKAAFPAALLIHRLDMETSGIMVFAMTRLAQRSINRQFEKRIVRKTYVARVAGRVEAEEGRIALPLIADWPNRPLQMVCHDTGKAAVTAWRVIAREDGATRLELRPETGRSHQLRVHLREIGHPILGDPFYAPEAVRAAAPRLQLHAAALELRHPRDGGWAGWQAPCPF